ncbi:hypothetical protein HDU96_007577 [Phlyctochytrium bullatum]|nr:hypothetical protein HDU96_007577 [Phlyctochytrium bullatum]
MLLDLVCIVVGKPSLSPPFTISALPDVTISTFRELVGSRLEASLKSRGLRHLDLDLFRADHGPLMSDNPKLVSLAVSSHAFTPTEIRSVLPVTLITYNPSALLSEYFRQGETFSSLNSGNGAAIDVVVTVRRNAYNEARLQASLVKSGNSPRTGPNSPRNANRVSSPPSIDRPSSPGPSSRAPARAFTTGGSPSSPFSSSSSNVPPRPLTRPHSYGSLLARNPPPMTEITEEEEEEEEEVSSSSSRQRRAQRSASLSSLSSRSSGDILDSGSNRSSTKDGGKYSTGVVGASLGKGIWMNRRGRRAEDRDADGAETSTKDKSEETSDENAAADEGGKGKRRVVDDDDEPLKGGRWRGRKAAVEAEQPVRLRERSRSADSHRSCPETFGRPSRDWGHDEDLDVDRAEPFIPASSKPVTPTRLTFAGFFAKTLSRPSSRSSLAQPETTATSTTAASTPLPGQAPSSGLQNEHDIETKSTKSAKSARLNWSSKRTTPAPDETVVEPEVVGGAGYRFSFLTSRSTKSSAKADEVSSLRRKVAGEDPTVTKTSSMIDMENKASSSADVEDGTGIVADEALGKADKLNRQRRRRMCLIAVLIVIIVIMCGAGVALFLVWPRTPSMRLVQSRRALDFEPIAGTSGRASGPTFIAQFKNDMVVEVQSPGYIPMSVTGFTISGFMVADNGTEVRSGNFTGILDSGTVPARTPVNFTLPTLFTYTTFRPVNLTGDQVVTYNQIVKAVCILVAPGNFTNQKLNLNYELKFSYPAFSWTGYSPRASGNFSIPC